MTALHTLQEYIDALQDMGLLDTNESVVAVNPASFYNAPTGNAFNIMKEQGADQPRDGAYRAYFLGWPENKDAAQNISWPDRGTSNTRNNTALRWEIVSGGLFTEGDNGPEEQTEFNGEDISYLRCIGTGRIITATGELLAQGVTDPGYTAGTSSATSGSFTFNVAAQNGVTYISENSDNAFFVQSEGGNVVINNSTLTKASGASLAPVVAKGGTLTITNSTIMGNYLNYPPGGNAKEKWAELETQGGNNRESNILATPTLGNAGGLLIDGAEVTLSDSVIKDNGAEHGGIYLKGGGTITHDRTNIEANYGYRSGAIFIYDGTYNLNSGEIKTNHSVDNGTITVISNQSTLNVGKDETQSRPKITNNITLRKGGGIYVCSNNVNIERAEITDNVAYSYGGGIYIHYVGEKNNPAKEIDKEEGGYVLKLSNTAITNNTATTSGVVKTPDTGGYGSGEGGGIWLCATNNLYINTTDTAIWDNTADSHMSDDFKKTRLKGIEGTGNLESFRTSYKDNWLDADGNSFPESVTLPYTGQVALVNSVPDNTYSVGDYDVVISGNTGAMGGGIGSNGELLFTNKEVNDYDVSADFKVKKTWDSTVPEDYKRPIIMKITYQFPNSDSVVEEITLNSENGYEASIQLPQIITERDENGDAKKYIYDQLVNLANQGDEVTLDEYFQNGEFNLQNWKINIEEYYLNDDGEKVAAGSLYTMSLGDWKARVVNSSSSTNSNLHISFKQYEFSTEATNSMDTHDLQVKKIDENNVALPGAKFALYKGSDLEGANPILPNEDGNSNATVFNWENLNVGYYYIKETQAPSNANGYDGKIWIKINPDGTVKRVGDITVPNTKDEVQDVVSWPDTMDYGYNGSSKLTLNGQGLGITAAEDHQSNANNNKLVVESGSLPLTFFEATYHPDTQTTSIQYITPAKMIEGENYYIGVHETNQSAKYVLMGQRYDYATGTYDYTMPSLGHEGSNFFNLRTLIDNSWTYPVYQWRVTTLDGKKVLQNVGTGRFLAVVDGAPKLINQADATTTATVQVPVEGDPDPEPFDEVPAIATNDNGVALVSVTNERVNADISITKTDEDDTALEGAGFTLFNSDNTVAREEVKGGSTFSFEDIEPGSYYIKETTAPTKYDGFEGRLPFEVVKPNSLVFTGLPANIGVLPSGQLTIAGKPLYASSNTKGSTITTEVTNFPIKLKQNGEDANELVENNEYRLVAGNTNFYVQDRNSGKEGNEIFEFAGLNSDEAPDHISYTWKFVKVNGTYVLNANKDLGLYLYLDGETVKLTRATNRLFDTDVVTWDVQDMQLSLTVANKQIKSKVSITKTDENGASITGATFQLYKADGTSPETTSANPQSGGPVFTFEGLVPGAYYLEETVPPNGYMKYDGKISFTIDNDGKVSMGVSDTTTAATGDKTAGGFADVSVTSAGMLMLNGRQIYFNNYSNTDGVVSYGLNDGNGSPMQVFEYYGPNNEISENPVTELVKGKTYVLKVAEDPTRFVQGRWWISQGNWDSTRLRNAYNGVQLKIPYYQWVYEPINDSGSMGLKVKSTVEPNAQSTNLAPAFLYYDGTEGRLLSDTANNGAKLIDGNKVTATEDTRSIALTVKNTKRSFVQVAKVDEENEPVAGATLQVLDTNGNIVKDVNGNLLEWTTTTEPKTFEILAGTYTLRETVTPTGHIGAADVTFTVDAIYPASSPYTVTMINANDIPDSVRLSKVETIDGNKVYVAGAELQIQKKEGNTWVPLEPQSKYTWTSESGPTIFTDIPAGSYRLVELTAPAGYSLEETAVEFTVVGKPQWMSSSNKSLSTQSVGAVNQVYFRDYWKNLNTDLYGKITEEVYPWMTIRNHSGIENIVYCLNRDNPNVWNDLDTVQSSIELATNNTTQLRTVAANNTKVVTNQDKILKALWLGYPSNAANLMDTLGYTDQLEKEKQFYFLTQAVIYHYTNDDKTTVNGKDSTSTWYQNVFKHTGSDKFQEMISLIESAEYPVPDSFKDVRVFNLTGTGVNEAGNTVSVTNLQPIVETYWTPHNVEIEFDNTRERGQVSVEKIWTNADGTSMAGDDSRIQQELKVTLKRMKGDTVDSTFSEETTLKYNADPAKSWKHTFTNLDIVDYADAPANRVPYVYFIEEEDPGVGFTHVDYSGSDGVTTDKNGNKKTVNTTVTVNNATGEKDVTIQVENKENVYDFEIVKIDARSAKDVASALQGLSDSTERDAYLSAIIAAAGDKYVLNGARFELQPTAGGDVINPTVDSTTKVIKFADLAPGYYTLTEKAAPEHYQLGSTPNWYIQIKADGTVLMGAGYTTGFEIDTAKTTGFVQAGKTGIVAIENEVTTYVLPATGGIGTTIFVVIGVLLMVVAGVLFVRRNGRQGA